MSTPNQILHPFPRLPLELQIEIFQFAASSAPTPHHLNLYFRDCFSAFLRNVVRERKSNPWADDDITPVLFLLVRQVLYHPTLLKLAWTCRVARKVALGALRKAVSFVGAVAILGHEERVLKAGIIARLDGLIADWETCAAVRQVYHAGKILS